MSFMDETFENSEDATTEKDFEAYKKFKTQQVEDIKQKFLYLNEQKLLRTNYIIDVLKNTFLFPYVLEMEHLIGNLEGIQMTDNPVKLLERFFFPKIEINIINPEDGSIFLGFNDLFDTNFTPKDILEFNVFRYKTKLANPDRMGLPLFINSYLLIRNCDNMEDNYFFFSEIENKLLNQNITLELLDRAPEIKKLKDLINNKGKQ